LFDIYGISLDTRTTKPGADVFVGNIQLCSSIIMVSNKIFARLIPVENLSSRFDQCVTSVVADAMIDAVFLAAVAPIRL
jgi:hypothetical protein